MITLLLMLLAFGTPSALADEGAMLQTIVLPSLRAPTMIDVPLPPEAQSTGGDTVVIRNGDAAVQSTILTDEVELMPEATLVRAPAAAPTMPKTKVEAAFDDDRSSIFQPVTAKKHVFLFTFPRVITPDRFTVNLDSGTVGKLSVRTGMTQKDLHDAFIGETAAETISLSAEQAQVVEVTMEVGSGVFQINNMSLQETRKRVSFRAIPNGTYALLYGPNVRTPNITEPYVLPPNVSASATLGEVSATNVQDDFDGISSDKDNCPNTWNADQEDRDQDGVGNACDNCPLHANPAQEDVNNNGIGNVCDDDDKDGVINSVDNCPLVKNTVQEDEDRDGLGNVCDTTDNRFTADKPWVLWVAIGAVVIVLSVVSAMIFKQTA